MRNRVIEGGLARVPDAMRPGFQCVRTRWNRGFMAFRRAGPGAGLDSADGRGGRGAQPDPELGVLRPAGLRLHYPQAGALQRLG